MSDIARLSNSAVPIERDRLEAMLHSIVAMRQDCDVIGAFLIGRLDDIDGDTDLEPNGDELDATGAEEEALLGRPIASGPGCILSDDDSAVDDRNCDDIDQDLERDA